MIPGDKAERNRLVLVHVIEALVSAASNLLTIGVFFFMEHRFQWTLKSNFILSAGLGAVYVVGALAADPISRRLGRRRSLATAYLTISVITLVAALLDAPAVFAGAVLCFAGLSATTWPIVENLISSGEPDPHRLSRRLAVYNIVWAASGSLVIAGNGLLIEIFPLGVFLIPSAVCLVAGAMVMFGSIEPPSDVVVASHPEPEPRLARQRILALWLSRISVPAMYLMIYSLAAMMPLLPVIQRETVTMRTLICSVWLATRFATFVFLGATVFWHARPRLLLVAGMTLLLSLLAITLPQNLGIMIAGQLVFGVATGLIYTASLYFGMVLSEGSTEHGGYHEALIGFGMTLGPAVGAVSQWWRPGDQTLAVVGIASLIGISIVVASGASIRLRRASG